MPIQPLTQQNQAATAGITIFFIAGAALFASWLPKMKLPDPSAGARFASVVGITVLAILYLLYRLFSDTWKLSPLYKGADARPSTSKFQAFIWTVIAIFAYSGIYALRASTGSFQAVSEVPTNLMLAMGFTFTTLAAAKGITVSYVRSGQVTKTGPAADEATSVAREDGGEIDLTKIQMLAWTYIAAAVYLFHLVHFFNVYPGGGEQFPDIDDALMVLMGLSQGLYVGKKLATTDTPALTAIGPVSGPPGSTLVIGGTAFGATQGLSAITLDGVPQTGAKWSDSQIEITIPATHPIKGAWTNHQEVKIDVAITGRSSVQPLQFTVVLPVIASATKTGTNVTIKGEGFGVDLKKGAVTIAGTKATIGSWSDQEVVAAIPAGATGTVDLILTAGSATTQPFQANL